MSESTIKYCYGCGVRLQHTDPEKTGYVVKPEQALCQRCYRLTHYGDTTRLKTEEADSDEVLREIASIDALYLYVADLTDFEGSMIPGINRHLANKDLLLVATKRDLLPVTMSNSKLLRFVQSRMKAYGCEVKGIVVIGDYAKDGIDEVEHGLRLFRKGRAVVALGMANAGKSTLLNQLVKPEKTLTVSPYPHTTLRLNAIRCGDYTVYDSPGIRVENSLWNRLSPVDIRKITLDRAYAPRSFQLRDDQTIIAGGLCAISIYGCNDVSLTSYLSENVLLHRTKAERRDEFLEKHFDELEPRLIERPALTQKTVYQGKNEKTDIVINQLGWFCIQGEFTKIEVLTPVGVNVLFRKAMI